ncbi:MAG: hypothetical protein H0X39_05175 [Actinobacteria bacterium]|nr:hypothetical protein [Actinomycetota bacterium]
MALALISQRNSRRRFVALFGMAGLRGLLDVACAELKARPAATTRREPQAALVPQVPVQAQRDRSFAQLRKQLQAFDAVLDTPSHAPGPIRAATTFDSQQAQPAAGAGVVLLWPLLPKLFGKLGLAERGKFIDEQARSAAAGYISQIIWPDDVTKVREMIPILLAGLAIGSIEPVQRCVLTNPVEALLDDTIGSLARMVPGLFRLGPADLRLMFLGRRGTVSHDGEGFIVDVEADATDVLLRQLPWPLSPIALPWLAAPLAVRWVGHDA